LQFIIIIVDSFYRIDMLFLNIVSCALDNVTACVFHIGVLTLLVGDDFKSYGPFSTCQVHFIPIKGVWHTPYADTVRS